MGYVLVVGVLLGTVMAAWLQGRASNVDSALMFGGTIFFGVLWGGWGLVLGPLLVVSTRAILRHASTAPMSNPAPATRSSAGRAMAQVTA
jgi:predicted PurR-regulated permease PerM